MSDGGGRGPTVSRRHFLVAGASGLTIGVALQSLPGLRGVAGAATTPATETTTTATTATSAASAATITTATMNAYIQITSDNKVTVMYGGSELGQGTKTGLAQIVAEELKVPWTSVTVAQADADPTIS